jgi:hypothetical protein
MAGSALHTGEVLPVHVDESGVPCERHPTGMSSGVLHHALVGSRTQGTHHDLASRLQSLLMAIEEIVELAQQTPKDGDLRIAADTALAALTQANDILAAHRSFARGSGERVRAFVRDLLTRASRRTGVSVDVSSLGDVEINVLPARAEQALALLLEVLGADLVAARKVTAEVEITDTSTVLTLRGGDPGAPRAQATDLVTLASYALGCDHGRLRCGAAGEPDRFIIAYPV